jgi:hypothetical protein
MYDLEMGSGLELLDLRVLSCVGGCGSHDQMLPAVLESLDPNRRHPLRSMQC